MAIETEKVPKEAREFKTPEKIIEESKPIVKEILDRYQEELEKNSEINSVEFENRAWRIDIGSEVAKDVRKLFFSRSEPTRSGEQFTGYTLSEGKWGDVGFTRSEAKFIREHPHRPLDKEGEEINSVTKKVENGDKALAELKKIQEAIREGKFNFSQKEK